MMYREEKARENLRKNIDYLMSKNQITTQRQFAERVGISTALLSKIKKDTGIPSVFPFFYRIREVFDLTVEDMLYHDLEEEERLNLIESRVIPPNTYSRCIGLYEIFHFRTDVSKGMETGLNGSALRAGILLAYKDLTDSAPLTVVAIFNKRKDEADALYRQTEAIMNEQGCEAAAAYISGLAEEHIYYGSMELTMQQIYISMKFEHRDRAYMIFHYAEGTSENYIGGLGCLVSTGKGRYCKPCMQYVGLSRPVLDQSNDEIASHLILPFPKLKSFEYIDDLMDDIHSMYSPEGETENGLKDEDKRLLISYHLEKIIHDIVQKNLFRTLAVTSDDDSSWYHYVKAVSRKKK